MYADDRTTEQIRSDVAVCTVWACVDCHYAVNFGDMGDAEPKAQCACDALAEREGGTYVVDADETDEFSWRPCECCGSTLGGSRHRLAVLA